MERPSDESAAGNDQQQTQSSTMKQQPQHHQAQLQVLHHHQSFGQPSSSQQRSSSLFPPLNLSGSTVFEWAAPMKPASPIGSGANQHKEAISHVIKNTMPTMTVNDDIIHKNADPSISITSHTFQEDTLALVTSNLKPVQTRPSSMIEGTDPTVSSGPMTQISTICTPIRTHTPQHHHHHHHAPMDPKYQSLVFLQTAAEQETVNKAIERQNALIHQHLVAMAKQKSNTVLDEEIEVARMQLRQQSLQEQTQKRRALAKENAKIQLKLAQAQKSPEKKLAPVVERRLEDLKQDRLEKQEEQRQRNEQVEKDNTRLELKMAQLQWRQPMSHLDPDIKLRRKEYREERRHKTTEERKHKKQILAKENARLKQRLAQVTGKVVKQLDPMVEQRRLDLVEERRRSLEQLKQAQARQVSLASSSVRSKTRVTNKSPTNTSLDSSIQQRRHELEQQRRQKAECKRLELRAHTKAMKERIGSAKGKDPKSLDEATKSKRKELQEKRVTEKLQQEQERKKQNLAMRNRRSQFLESDEYYDNSPAATARRFSFDLKEQRQLQRRRQQQAERKKKEELETHRKEFLKRTRGVDRGRTAKSLDAKVEALRKDLAQKSISDNQERTQELRKQNVELKQRLSGISGKETKSLSGVVQAIRSEREQSRKQAALQRHKELVQHQRAYKKRLSDVTSKDNTKLTEATQTIRSQRNAKRDADIRQKQKELAQRKARLQQMVKNVKSPIQQMLNDTSSSSPPLTFSKFRSSSGATLVVTTTTTTTQSPVSFVSIDTKASSMNSTPLQTPPLQRQRQQQQQQQQQQQLPGIKLFDFQSMSNASTTPESLIEAANQASSSSEKKRLGPKRIVEACQRNQQLRDQNLKLRKRLAKAAAVSIQQLEASITP